MSKSANAVDLISTHHLVYNANSCTPTGCLKSISPSPQDTMDDAFGEEEDEEETDAIVNQVLDEIGINLDGELAAAPVAAVDTGAESQQDADLQARFENLRQS